MKYVFSAIKSLQVKNRNSPIQIVPCQTEITTSFSLSQQIQLPVNITELCFDPSAHLVCHKYQRHSSFHRQFLSLAIMVFFASHITLFGLIAGVSSYNLFQKSEDFEDTFCANKMIPHGIKRSPRECARLCSLNSLCTGFFFDFENNCYLTEEQLLDVNSCSIRIGHYYTSLGMLIFQSNSIRFSDIWVKRNHFVISESISFLT